jgi:hypothetical protein
VGEAGEGEGRLGCWDEAKEVEGIEVVCVGVYLFAISDHIANGKGNA